MVAGGLPTLTVLLDDGTGTFPYDISTFARMQEGYTGTRGRSNELSEVEPGDLGIALDNTDGRFTLGSTIIASPSPIKMDQRVRVKLTANATTVNRFTQHVQNWPVEWPSGNDLFAVANISATDMQARAERRQLQFDFAEYAALSTAGRAGFLYPLSTGPFAGSTDANPTTTVKLNEGPTNTGSSVTYGATLANGMQGATFTAASKWLGDTSASLVSGGGGRDAIYLVFQMDVAPSAIFSQMFGNLTREVGIQQTTGAVGSASGTWSAKGYADGVAHLMMIALATGQIWVDGVNVATAGGSFATGTDYKFGAITTGSATTLLISNIFNGFAADVANAQSSFKAWVGESGTARISRLAGYGSLPVGTLDASLTNLAAINNTGNALAAALRDAADAEFGLVFVDGSGNLTFHNRNRAVSKTAPDVTIDANFLAEGTRFECDMQGVLNYFETTAAGTGAVQVVRNMTSEVTNQHGRYPESKTYSVQTDPEAFDRANWVVSTHAEPQPRVGSLAFDLLTMTAAQQAAMLTLEADSWLRVTSLPGQTPGSTTADFIVQGFSESLNTGAWMLTFNAANKAFAAPNAWILGDATNGVLGSTTRIYF